MFLKTELEKSVFFSALSYRYTGIYILFLVCTDCNPSDTEILPNYVFQIKEI